MNAPTRVRITCELTDDQAWLLAEFCKRISFSDVRATAATTAEAYGMLEALAQLQRALADAGYAPR